MIWSHGKPIVLAAILVVAVTVYVASFTYTVGHGIDDGIHIVTAKSLAAGQGLRLISDPQRPVSTQFPPGLSLLLVPVVTLFPDPPGSIIPLKLVSTVFALLYVAVAWFWLHRHVPPSTAALLTMITAINPETIRFAGQVMAEMSYAAVSMAGLVCVERYEKATDTTSRGRRWLVVAVLMMTTGYLFRSIGLSLILAVLGLLALRRRWVAVVAVIVGVLVLASPWLMRSAVVGTPEYRDQFWLKDLEDPERGRIGVSGLIERAAANAVVYTTQAIPDHLFPPLGGQRVIDWCRQAGVFPLLIGARLCLSAFVVAGFWQRVRTRVEVLDLYTVVYFGTLLLWHNRLHWKYLAPVTPILLVYLTRGLEWMMSRLPRFPVPVRAALPAVLLLLLVGNGVRGVDYVENGWLVQGKVDPYRAAYGWLKAETPPYSRLMGIDHLGLYLYTGRKAIAPGYGHNPADVLRYIESTRTDYFVVAPGQVTSNGVRLDEQFLRPVIARYPDRFTLVYTDPQTAIQVYRVGLATERRERK
ncbi:MAG: hypothetical protein HY710_07035 [Candidatus Latescibacteria bacterium]|nr:hypothetical protein [Candidatus Latescibacterota bacterium]